MAVKTGSDPDQWLTRFELGKIEKILSDIRNSTPNEYELEYFLVHQDRYRYLLCQITATKLPPGARVLDLGCYPPHLFAALKSFGLTTYGVSSRHEPVKAPKVAILNIETDRLPFADNFFDLILFSEVIEHLIVSPVIYLAELKRILKPTGRLMITTPNAVGLHKRIPVIFGRSPYFPVSQLYDTRYHDDSIYSRHNREFTLKELAEILEKAGFVVTRKNYFSGYGPFREKITPEPPFKKGIKILTSLVTFLYPKLKDSLYFEAVPAKETMTEPDYKGKGVGKGDSLQGVTKKA